MRGAPYVTHIKRIMEWVNLFVAVTLGDALMNAGVRLNMFSVQNLYSKCGGFCKAPTPTHALHQWMII